MSPVKLYFIDSFSNSEIKWSEMLSAERFGCVNMAAIILLQKKMMHKNFLKPYIKKIFCKS